MAFRNSAVTLDTIFTDIYTCPANYECVVHSLYFANLDDVNTIAVDTMVDLNFSTQGEHYVIKNVAIPAGTTLIFDKPITLRAGDVLKAKTSMPSSCDVMVSLLLTLADNIAP